jgi:thioredoxin-like negative regulator of GroEL
MTALLCATLVQFALALNSGEVAAPAAKANAAVNEKASKTDAVEKKAESEKANAEKAESETAPAEQTDAEKLGAKSYAAARKLTEKTGKPILIMVSTDWCAPCQLMKKTILPRVRKRGLFRNVAFAMVNPDQDRELADEITGGGPIPQLVMFRKTSKGWMRSKLIGSQSEDAVEEFIKDGVASNDADRKADKKDEKAEKQKSHEEATARSGRSDDRGNS